MRKVDVSNRIERIPSSPPAVLVFTRNRCRMVSPGVLSTSTLDRLLSDLASRPGAAFRQLDASPNFAEFLCRSDFLFCKLFVTGEYV